VVAAPNTQGIDSTRSVIPSDDVLLKFFSETFYSKVIVCSYDMSRLKVSFLLFLLYFGDVHSYATSKNGK